MARKRSAPRIITEDRWKTDLRGILGVRVSEGRDRGHTRISEDVQETKARRQAEAHQLEIIHLYREIGISGDAGREDLEAAIVMIEQRQAAWLVVAEVDRLGRDVRDIYDTFHRIHQAGGCVLIAEPLMNSADENSRIVLNLLASLAESQRVKIARKWDDAQTSAWERGVFPGTPPFGYRNPDKAEQTVLDRPGHPVLQIVPDQAARIREAAKALIDGCSYPMATKILGLEDEQYAFRLFSNRTLVGEISRRGHRTVQDAHEPILSLSDFETINGRRTTSVTARQNAPTTLGAGVLRCAGCRYTLHKRSSHGDLYYYCRTPDCKHVTRLDLDTADDLLWQAAAKAHGHIEGTVFEEPENGGRSIGDVDTDLSEVRLKRRKVAERLADDPDDEDVCAAMDILKRKITDLENERTALQAAKRSLRAVFMLDMVDQLSVGERNESVRAVLDAVFVTSEGEFFPHRLGSYPDPLPSKGRQVPRAPYRVDVAVTPAL